MAGTQDVALYKDALIILSTAAIVVPVTRRLKISPIIVYLTAGLLLGPHGIAQLAAPEGWLDWVTISPENNLELVGELGVVFLLFLIGLELPMQRLMTMRRLVFGLGSLQIIVSGAVIVGFLIVLGLAPGAAVLIGLSLALSSTAVVLELLSQQQRLSTSAGRTAFAILLMQDLAVVPLIILVAVLAGSGNVSVVAGVLTALIQATVALIAVAGVGSLVLRPLFRHVASTESQELFVAATLLVIVASGLVTGAAGLSMALGAFVAGLLLAETEYRRAIHVAIDPVKGILLGVFFFTVGMRLDMAAIFADPSMILMGTFGLIALKAALLVPLLQRFGVMPSAIAEVALLLGPGGEFAFIVVGLAAATGVVKAETATIIFAVTTLSMLLLPFVDLLGRFLAGKLATSDAPAPELLVSPTDEDAKPRAVIIGFGRVGRLLSEMLEEHRIPHLAIEHNPDNVTPWRHRGRPVYYGDAGNEVFLREAGLAKADAVLVTINSPSIVDDIVQQIRSINPKVVIVARARDAEHARKLYELGATDAVPETIEASLQLAEASLVELGVPTGLVIASIHGKRDQIRDALQGTGRSFGYAGQAGSGSARHAGANAGEANSE